MNEQGPETNDAGTTFTSEQGLQELAKEWPMKRLVEIWNHLPGVHAVARFTDRKTAVARIWRAIQPQTEADLPSTRRASKTQHRLVFRAGSKAAGLHFAVPARRRHPERDPKPNRVAGPYGAWVHLAQPVQAKPESALL
jgi:hypothetical protein